MQGKTLTLKAQGAKLLLPELGDDVFARSKTLETALDVGTRCGAADAMLKLLAEAEASTATRLLSTKLELPQDQAAKNGFAVDIKTRQCVRALVRRVEELSHLPPPEAPKACAQCASREKEDASSSNLSPNLSPNKRPPSRAIIGVVGE
eukprot:Colp12_sorted_trinity150504_noHs@34865